jgi:carboxyl-terminal processing protease
MNLFEAVEVIRGPKGSEVILTVYREADNTIDEYTVTRDAVNVPSVDGELLDIAGKNILYMEISIIGEDTLLSLRELVTAYKPDVDGVILDLRGNGGGYLPLAVNVASYFLPRNEMVTTAKYTTLPDEVYRSKGYGDFE